MTSKICDVATQCCHRTALWMTCSAVANGFPLDTVFLCGEEKAEKVYPGLCGRACGGQGRIEGLLADEELEVLEEEKFWAVSAPPLQYSPGLRRKKKSIQAGSLIACWGLVPPW